MADAPAAAEQQVTEIPCQGPLTKEQAGRNIAASIAARYPRFLGLPEVGKRKSSPIAIAAGGPSIRGELESLRKFKTIIACGTAHDYLIERGVNPKYCVIFDPVPDGNLHYFDRQLDTCTYLIASHCDPAVFETFKEAPVAIWHALGDAEPAAFQGEGTVMGGCTAALRAIVIAVLMGYWDHHYFGFDSCYAGEDSHAYQQDEALPLPVSVRTASGREFKTNPNWIAQAQQFFKGLEVMKGQFRATVHGDGLIAEMMRPVPPRSVEHGADAVPAGRAAAAA